MHRPHLWRIPPTARRITRAPRPDEIFPRAAKGRFSTTTNPVVLASEHQEIALRQGLLITSSSSPGSPLLLPHGAHIFNILVSFLRAHHRRYGFQEVITPTIYKKSLWMQSGHWDKFQDDMFEVKGRRGSIPEDPEVIEDKDETYGLKPMNCPGHCLLFASSRRSYRDLPIRYAEYGPLHRNELSGTLNGLTRVRRFHQDDGHIFCEPAQVAQEISSTLELIAAVYRTFQLPAPKFVLSTRPDKRFIGTIEEWDQAEEALKDALRQSRQEWSMNAGDGAFYGPKIDVILLDSSGKEHQTATVQLDFQLPRRFGLEYDDRNGPATPVIIHRAVYGSLERFMALLIEHYQGRWPFWLSPRQAIVLTLNSTETVVRYAKHVSATISGQSLSRSGSDGLPLPPSLDQPGFTVDLDHSSRTLSKKIVEAKRKNYNMLVVVGPRDLEAGTLQLDITGHPNWEISTGILADIMSNHADSGPAAAAASALGNGRSITLQPELVYRFFSQLSHAYV